MESAEGTTDAGSRRALRKRSLFIGAFLLFGFFIALNAPYPYHTFTSAGGTPDTDFDFKINAALGQVTEAGWPLRYYIRHDFVDNTASTRPHYVDERESRTEFEKPQLDLTLFQQSPPVRLQFQTGSRPSRSQPEIENAEPSEEEPSEEEPSDLQAPPAEQDGEQNDDPSL